MLNHIIQKGDWFAKIDLQDAYLTVPVYAEDKDFLHFSWKGINYRFTCLPFGLASSPWAFTKLLKPVVAHLRSAGIRCIIYLDDTLIMPSQKPKRSRLSNMFDLSENPWDSLETNQNQCAFHPEAWNF